MSLCAAQRVFDGIVAQLHSLSQVGAPSEDGERAYERAFYILESLAQYKSAVLVVELSGADDGYAQLVSLVEAVLDPLREGHSGKVTSLAVDVVLACLEELPSPPWELSQALLRRVLPEYEEDHPVGWDAALEIVRRAAPSFQTALVSIATSVLVSGGETSGSASGDFSFQAFGSLLLNLAAQGCGSLLLPIVPRLEAELLVDDPAVRVRAVGLLGDLFSEETPSDRGTVPLALQYELSLIHI